MSYPGACKECGGDTGQDRIDGLVTEIEALKARLDKYRDALASIKTECEVCNWNCEVCDRDFDMTETDLYMYVDEALKESK